MVQQTTGRDVAILSQNLFIPNLPKDAQKLYSFTFYEGPGCASGGIIYVDENIFIIFISPTVSIRAITADITRPEVLLYDEYRKCPLQEYRQIVALQTSESAECLRTNTTKP
ncbi:hypothetical protein DL765_009040 [Monosporascus sp. GIB2]|nr:hypothetical protein DL765_009040 [Monosporascus sp. GIB2]